MDGGGGISATGRETLQYAASRYNALGRADLRAHGTLRVRRVSLDQDETELVLDIQQRGHQPSFAFAGYMASLHVTSTQRMRGAPPDVAFFDSDSRAAKAVVRVSRTPAANTRLHIAILCSQPSKDGTHTLRFQVAQAQDIELDQLIHAAENTLRLYDSLGAAASMGKLVVRLAAPTAAVLSTARRITRVSERDLGTVFAQYARRMQSELYSRYTSTVAFPDGTRYIHKASHDMIATGTGTVPLLVFMYGATRLSVPPAMVDAFADAQIRMGCLHCGLSPADLASATDAVKLLVLCYAARSLSWLISTTGFALSGPNVAPLGTGASIRSVGGLCVEHTILVTTVLLHIRNGSSALCHALQPVLSRYRIAQMVCTARSSAEEEFVVDGINYNQTRHVMTVLLDSVIATGAQDAKSHGGLPSSCLLDSVHPLPISRQLPHPGVAAADEWGVLSSKLKAQYGEQSAFLGNKRMLADAEKFLFVDRDSDVKETICLSLDARGGPPTHGVSVYDVYMGLSRARHRMFAPVILTPETQPLSSCAAVFDETRYLSNVVQDPDMAFYLSDKSHLYAAVQKAVHARASALKKGEALGWHVVAYDWSAPGDIDAFLEKATSHVTQGCGVSEVNAQVVGKAVFCDDVLATICLVAYIAGSK